MPHAHYRMVSLASSTPPHLEAVRSLLQLVESDARRVNSVEMTGICSHVSPPVSTDPELIYADG
jgi:hypothetical protein